MALKRQVVAKTKTKSLLLKPNGYRQDFEWPIKSGLKANRQNCKGHANQVWFKFLVFIKCSYILSKVCV